MSILDILILLLIIGVGLYLIQLIPMDATIKRIITILVIVLVILYILKTFFGEHLSIL